LLKKAVLLGKFRRRQAAALHPAVPYLKVIISKPNLNRPDQQVNG